VSEPATVWYIPEHITHLFYSPLYESLSLDQRLAYNRLHACYHCEVCAYLEVELPRFYLKAAAAKGVPAALRVQAQALADSEEWHSAAFRSLSRRIFPELYSQSQGSGGKDVFVRMSAGSSQFLTKLSGWLSLDPIFLWIALIQEERGAYFGEEILRHAEHLDHRMVEWQRKHLEDEREHISLGEALVPLHWSASPNWMRKLHGRLLGFVLREFLSTPKRTGLRVIEQFVKIRPELLPRKTELLDAMKALDGNPGFHESIYSRRIAPKTFALFDRYDEFRTLGKNLHGYIPEVPA
jgi:hypothetical protein